MALFQKCLSALIERIRISFCLRARALKSNILAARVLVNHLLYTLTIATYQACFYCAFCRIW